MHVVSEETFEQDGISYTKWTYNNGASETFQTGNPPRIVQPPILTEDQERQVNIQLGVETLLAMQELQTGLAI